VEQGQTVYVRAREWWCARRSDVGSRVPSRFNVVDIDDGGRRVEVSWAAPSTRWYIGWVLGEPCPTHDPHPRHDARTHVPLPPPLPLRRHDAPRETVRPHPQAQLTSSQEDGGQDVGLAAGDDLSGGGGGGDASSDAATPSAEPTDAAPDASASADAGDNNRAASLPISWSALPSVSSRRRPVQGHEDWRLVGVLGRDGYVRASALGSAVIEQQQRGGNADWR
jgi:hypothetical protein